MFVRLKKTGNYQYLQIVQTYREGKKVKQRVISTLGRLEELQEKGEIESILTSLSKYSQEVLMCLTGRGNPISASFIIGPVLIFERLWRECGLYSIINQLLEGRKFEFDVERAIFVTVLHRLFISGSDRSCEYWMKGYRIDGSERLSLHHFYRSMAFLGSPVDDQSGKTPFAPRCIKDLVEEKLFSIRRNLFTELELVFFDTTSIYFEGKGGDEIGQYGNSKDHRSDRRQMIVGAVLDNKGFPLCCEIWPGNIADVNTLMPVANRLRKRFGVEKMCIVADRGMISQSTVEAMEARGLNYILGVRMRRVNHVKREVLSRAGRYQEVIPEIKLSKAPAPLRVKEVMHNDTRYILCLNPRQARKDKADRDIIVESLRDRIKSGAKTMIGNKGYRKYLQVTKGAIKINDSKVMEEERYDGKWVLTTNLDMPADRIALKYKELWMVEHIFRDVKSILETRPIYHKVDETIRGHVFCSFLALVLRKELDMRMEAMGEIVEWLQIKQDLKRLHEVVIEQSGRKVALRTEASGDCHKVFKAVGMALPPTIRKMEM
jgi:transposase